MSFAFWPIIYVHLVLFLLKQKQLKKKKRYKRREKKEEEELKWLDSKAYIYK